MVLHTIARSKEGARNRDAPRRMTVAPLPRCGFRKDGCRPSMVE